jgi:hypothetical protein
LAFVPSTGKFFGHVVTIFQLNSACAIAARGTETDTAPAVKEAMPADLIKLRLFIMLPLLVDAIELKPKNVGAITSTNKKITFCPEPVASVMSSRSLTVSFLLLPLH